MVRAERKRGGEGYSYARVDSHRSDHEAPDLPAFPSSRAEAFYVLYCQLVKAPSYVLEATVISLCTVVATVQRTIGLLGGRPYTLAHPESLALL